MKMYLLNHQAREPIVHIYFVTCLCVYILYTLHNCTYIFLHMQLIPSWKWHVKGGQWSVSGFYLGSMGGESLPPLEIHFAPLSIVTSLSLKSSMQPPLGKLST